LFLFYHHSGGIDPPILIVGTRWR